MNYVNMSRRNGKTTMLIEAAYVTGYPIIVYDLARAQIVKDQAKKMGFDINVYSIQEFNKQRVNQYFKNAFIDEAKDIIDIALRETLGINVVACTLTLPMIDKQQNKEGSNNE